MEKLTFSRTDHRLKGLCSRNPLLFNHTIWLAFFIVFLLFNYAKYKSFFVDSLHSQEMAQPGSFFGHNRSGFGRERSISSTTSSASASRSDTPPSRAGNIVISSSEVGKIFDAINSLSNKMSTQEEMLKKLTTAMEDLEDEVQELKINEKSLLEKLK